MIRPGLETKEMREQQASLAYAATKRGAWVAALFCILVLGLMIGNRQSIRAFDPMLPATLVTQAERDPQLAKRLAAAGASDPLVMRIAGLKTRLIADSKNAKLKQQIRKLDAELRCEYLARLAFANQGGYVLLVGVGLFLIAGASAMHYRKKIPIPGPEELDSAAFRRSAAMARRSVVVFGTIIALSLTTLAVFSGDDLTAEYAKATRGYTRVVAKPEESAGSTQQAAEGPTAPGPTTASAAAAPSTPAAPTTPPNIGPLPVPGVPSGAGETNTAPSSGSNSTQSGEPEKPRPAPVKIDTTAFDESDYKPTAEDWAKNWPVFRGPNGIGCVESGDYPLTWNGETGDGILWKTEIALPGWNSPVVWGDRVFVSGADKEKREVYCLDASTGKLLWTQPIAMLTKQVEVMEDTGYAPSTMAIDGKRVFAIFPNGDMACLDFDGKQIWTKALGNPENMYGHASSLTMYGSLLMVLFDQGGGGDDSKSLLLALQGGTGNCVWYARRDVPNSWATPVMINTGTRLELITSANPWVISYDPITGRELWRASLMSGDVAPTPIFAGGNVLACNSGAVLAAIKPGEGDITKTNVLWQATDGLPDITSPVASTDLVFLADSMGNVTCVDLKTGAKVWDHNFEVPFQASPTVVGSRVYLPDHNGITHIITAGRTFNEEHASTLPEHISATPAFTNNRIYIRGEKHIYCVGRK